MQTLQVVQENFKSIGISPKREPFNRSTFNLLVLGSLGISLSILFVLLVAKNTQERMESIYFEIICTSAYLIFASTIVMKTELFSFIDGFDELTTECELNISR